MGEGRGANKVVMVYVKMVNSEHFCQSLGPSIFHGSTVS